MDHGQDAGDPLVANEVVDVFAIPARIDHSAPTQAGEVAGIAQGLKTAAIPATNARGRSRRSNHLSVGSFIKYRSARTPPGHCSQEEDASAHTLQCSS